ncbi:hypothetical protein [Streptomyces erythrochromogenes]|uniref:hypothetical protein n=1 Tax=Streptomyces erythrochromogenes TaxID=285574 RepID=UPI002F90D611|nr:hypothetical protein OG489_40180 [Streptomyces erythrochromogenes]WSR88912.1 hypothetical protein OG489_40030 [Streptomyces erythrochromogenes]
MTDKTPVSVTDTAAEAIRDLNHLTPDLQYPGDAYSTVANLSALAMRLPQALEQIAAFVKGLEEQGRLRSDKDTLDEDLAATYAGLNVAAAAAQTLYGALDQAHQGLGPVAYKD